MHELLARSEPDDHKGVHKASQKAPQKEEEPKKQVRIEEPAFVVAEEAPRKKKQVKRVAVAEKVLAPAPKVKSFTPRGSMSRFDDDAFEVVGNKKSAARQAFSDSESEEDRIPNLLYVRINPNREDLSQSILQALMQVPEDQNSIMNDNLSSIKKLLTTSKLTAYGGW